MLEQLLKEIRRGGPLETGKLAARLNTSPQMVAAMLAHLQQTGHIQSYQACDNLCAGCSLKSECTSSPVIQLWQTTGKLQEK
ncbi:MAG: MarR family transcriptional regulator, partial [Anaerolineales bacterium]|nr:MarR family transcriptional regulator [Anaerolineales bacterium]